MKSNYAWYVQTLCKIWQKSSLYHNGLKAQYVSNNMVQHRLMGNIV